jgi:hypothetical protein
MPYHRTSKVCLPISTLLQVHANHFTDTIDTDENMHALASTANKHYQIALQCRSQMVLPLETENFAFVDLIGDDYMDYGAFNNSDVPVPDAVDECYQITLREQSVLVPTTAINPAGLQANDAAMPTSEGESYGLLAHKLLIPLRWFCNRCSRRPTN